MRTGIVIWKEQETGARGRPVALREIQVLHLGLLCAEVRRGERTPEAVLRCRLLAAGRKLRKAGVKKVILPAVLPEGITPERMELERVSTVPLRQMIAADWARMELERKGLPIAGSRVAVSASRLTGEVVRTVTELVLRHRYVLLDVPRGREELGCRLRREYGVSLLDGTDPGQRDKAEALIGFEEGTFSNPLVLRLWDETVPLPRLLLPSGLEEQLPAGGDRGQLLSVLLQGGALRPGQVGVGVSGT